MIYSGRIKKLTVEFGGFLDIGDKLVAVAFKNTSMKNGGIALEAAEQELEKRQEFNYYENNLRPEYYYRPSPRAYGRPYNYLRQPYSYSYQGPPSHYPYEAPSRYQRGYPGRQEMLYGLALSPSRFLASVVMDRRLINEEGKNIGWVEDLIIDRKNNNVEKIVLSSLEIIGEDV
ncbi:MAG: PRC-barrel domain-containing protein [Thermodesulfobacteriota bacterium]